VFGILQITFGGLGILGGLLSLVSSVIDPEYITYADNVGDVVGIVISAFMIFNGIRLFGVSQSSRIEFIIYCIVSVVFTLVISVIAYLEMYQMLEDEGSVEMMPFVTGALFIGSGISLIYPIVGFCFFVRPAVSKSIQAYRNS
jgi:hypothetical protein